MYLELSSIGSQGTFGQSFQKNVITQKADVVLSDSLLKCLSGGWGVFRLKLVCGCADTMNYTCMEMSWVLLITGVWSRPARVLFPPNRPAFSRWASPLANGPSVVQQPLS